MNPISITLTLPEDLVEQAQEAGILTNERIAEFLQSELERQQRVQRYFETLDALAAIEPPMTEAEIQAEIDAYRREKHQSRTNTSE